MINMGKKIIGNIFDKIYNNRWNKKFKKGTENQKFDALKKNYKIFCIGCNKTGTTSLEKAFKDFGYRLGDQKSGELLLESYIKRDFGDVIDFAKTADVFQDAPFSFPFTFIPLHQAFPNAKFILTVRDNEEQWYNSMIKFHSKVYGKLPDYETIINSEYRYPGYMWRVRSKVFNITKDMDMYDRDTFRDYYNQHNFNVRNYFKNNDNFLEINLSQDDAYKRLCNFINHKPLYDKFPWENKS